jgi:hypothetical protein
LGPVLIDEAVASYYEQYPLQLASDFPDEGQDRLWRHIGRVLDAAGADDQRRADERPAGRGSVLDVCEVLARTGSLPAPARHRWAQREAGRVLRARQLGLPEQHPTPLASELEVRRARLTVV